MFPSRHILPCPICALESVFNFCAPLVVFDLWLSQIKGCNSLELSQRNIMSITSTVHSNSYVTRRSKSKGTTSLCKCLATGAAIYAANLISRHPTSSFGWDQASVHINSLILMLRQTCSLIQRWCMPTYWVHWPKQLTPSGKTADWIAAGRSCKQHLALQARSDLYFDVPRVFCKLSDRSNRKQHVINHESHDTSCRTSQGFGPSGHHTVHMWSHEPTSAMLWGSTFDYDRVVAWEILQQRQTSTPIDGKMGW